jgi:hypothetical protein
MSNAELRAVKGGTVSDTAMAGSNPLVAAVSGLVPHSGIQFIGLRLKTSALPATVSKFIEEADAEDGPMLIPLNEPSEFDGAELRPIPANSWRRTNSFGFPAIRPWNLPSARGSRCRFYDFWAVTTRASPDLTAVRRTGSPLARSVLAFRCRQHRHCAPLVRRGNQFRFDATAFRIPTNPTRG